MLGLARTSAASGSLLMNLEGFATMAIAWVVFRENVDRRLLLGAASILAGACVLSWQGQGLRIDGRRLADRRGLSRMGRRQQPDTQTLVGRSRHHCADQRSCGGRREPDFGAAARRPLAVIRRDWRGVRGRVLRRRSQSRLVCSGAPSSRQRADGGLFLARAVPRRDHRDRPLKRASHGSAHRRRRADGFWPLAASDRTP